MSADGRLQGHDEGQQGGAGIHGDGVSARQVACKGGPWFRANEWKRARDGHCSLSKQAGSEGGSWEETKRQEDLIAVEMVDS